jgi:hypothetical protein
LHFRPSTYDLIDHIALTHADGRRSRHRVFAPNVLVPDYTGAPVLRCCGWQRHATGAGSRLTTDFGVLFWRRSRRSRPATGAQRYRSSTG